MWEAYDLGNEDFLWAGIPFLGGIGGAALGGVAGRVFHPHATDQIDAFMDGGKMYWWFSDREIADHTRSVLTLTPSAATP